MEKLNVLLASFKTDICEFMGELLEQFPQELTLVMMNVFLQTKVESKDLMDMFIHYCLPHKEKISNREENFFLHELQDSGDMSLKTQNYINGLDSNYLKRLWKSSVLEDDDRKIIWAWMDRFIEIAEEYQKEYEEYLKVNQ